MSAGSRWTPPQERDSIDRRRLPPGLRERRVRLVAPLYRYAADHGISMQWVMRTAYQRRGERAPSTMYVAKIKEGRAVLPDWLIPACCEAIDRPMGEIMGWCGPEWIAEFGAEYGVQSETAA